jgi:hypothetical protein
MLLQDSDLTQEADLVVEQLLFDDLAVLPARNGTELQLERSSCRLVNLTV